MNLTQDKLNEAKKLSITLAKKYKPEKIVLFGSVSRKKDSENSDIDLLIIKSSSKKRPYRSKEVYKSLRGIKRKYALDVIVYTPKEIEDRIELGDHFVKSALSDGLILYG